MFKNFQEFSLKHFVHKLDHKHGQWSVDGKYNRKISYLLKTVNHIQVWQPGCIKWKLLHVSVKFTQHRVFNCIINHGCKIFISLIICVKYVAIYHISFTISSYFFVNYREFVLLLSYFFKMISPTIVLLFCDCALDALCKFQRRYDKHCQRLN